jgi:hypothetical protein
VERDRIGNSRKKGSGSFAGSRKLWTKGTLCLAQHKRQEEKNKMVFLSYYHTSMRWALRNMTAPEFKIYTYLISIPIRAKKAEINKYKNGIEVYDLYRKGNLLPVNVSVDRIAEECKLGARTVHKAISRFNELGAILKTTNHKGRHNNVYLVGIKNMWYTTEDDFKSEHFFTEFSFIQNGEALPDAVRYFILNNRYDAETLAHEEVPDMNKTLGDLFVSDYPRRRAENTVRLFQVKG